MGKLAEANPVLPWLVDSETGTEPFVPSSTLSQGSFFLIDFDFFPPCTVNSVKTRDFVFTIEHQKQSWLPRQQK